MAHLFTPRKVGAYTLSHRVVLAPMTRLRTIQPGDIPSPMMADFYGQRASKGGLEIVEGVSVSIAARSYLGAASFYHDGQMEGWKAIANAVHAKGGRVFMQLIHGGRQSHVEMTGGVDPVAPSVVPFDGVALTKDGFVPASPHRALDIEEIPGIIEEFRVAAQRALDAGFDGVELHGANGYLVDQFIQDGTNKRTDAYGGPIENRVRFLREAVEALISVWGAERVGVRISPSGEWGGISDSDPEATFSYVAKVLDEYKIAYLHVIEPRIKGDDTLHEDHPPVAVKYLRPFFSGADHRRRRVRRRQRRSGDRLGRCGSRGFRPALLVESRSAVPSAAQPPAHAVCPRGLLGRQRKALLRFPDVRGDCRRLEATARCSALAPLHSVPEVHMSRTIRFAKAGGPEVLEFVETAGPRARVLHEVRIKVKAIGINRAESMWRTRRLYRTRQISRRVSGTKRRASSMRLARRSTGIAVGDEVNVIPSFSMNHTCTYGEVIVAPDYAVVKHPKSLSYAEAASVWMMFVTAYGALIEDAKVDQGRFRHHPRGLQQRRSRGDPDRQLRGRDPDCADAHVGKARPVARRRRRARHRHGRDRSGAGSDAHHRRQRRARRIRPGRRPDLCRS